MSLLNTRNEGNHQLLKLFAAVQFKLDSKIAETEAQKERLEAQGRFG